MATPVPAPVGDSMKLGEWGEEAAASFLSKLGYEILERRYRCPPIKGDIDLIARDSSRNPACLVFVEVKTRRSKDVRVAEAAVHWAKRRAVVRLAGAYIQRLRRPTAWRYDVMSVYPGPVIEHIIEAFTSQTR